MELGDLSRGKTASVVILGTVNLKLFRELCERKPQQLLVKELPENLSVVLPEFADRVPLASLAFNSIEFLSRVK